VYALADETHASITSAEKIAFLIKLPLGISGRVQGVLI
jgi:hypothetical protein